MRCFSWINTTWIHLRLLKWAVKTILTAGRMSRGNRADGREHSRCNCWDLFGWEAPFATMFTASLCDILTHAQLIQSGRELTDILVSDTKLSNRQTNDKKLPQGIFPHPSSRFHMSAVPPSSLSCLDPSLLYGMTGLLHYVFTMSEPQAAHASPLMPPDLEQVVNMIPSEGFNNTGSTLCRGGKKARKDSARK